MEFLKKHKTLLAAAGLFVLAVAYLIGANNIKIYKGMGASSVGSAFYPRMLGWLLVGLTLVQIIGHVRKLTVQKKQMCTTQPETTESEKETNYLAIGAVIAITAVYVALLEIIGFLIMSALYLFALILIMAPKKMRRIWMAAIIAVVTSIAVYFIFVKGFTLVLPRGILG
ncbi:MAG: tripartite tricarboxylate transporter TctB family protein [Sphaerochaetaceae bacterium]|jgi:putative tricarboxylic transport membrane protein|nr:tripartite tricarboxylate transporter TctB family protein [Sphaerochaetaceae bacterium]